jgi:hypothetical protein
MTKLEELKAAYDAADDAFDAACEVGDAAWAAHGAAAWDADEAYVYVETAAWAARAAAWDAYKAELKKTQEENSDD